MIKYEICFLDQDEDCCDVTVWANNMVEAITFVELEEDPLAVLKVIRKGI